MSVREHTDGSLMAGRDRFGQWSYLEERGLAEIGAVSEPRYLNEGRRQDMTPDFFDRPMEEGAHLVGSSAISHEMNLFLAALAYTTGRFIDDAWFTTPGLLCRIPDGTWAHE
jgi:hypothetical protein